MVHGIICTVVIIGWDYMKYQIILNVLPFNHVFCLNCDVFITMRYGSTLCFCGNLNKMLYYINLFQPHFMRVVPMMAKALNSRALITLKQDPSLTPEEAGRKVWGQNLKKLASGGGYLAPELAESLAGLRHVRVLPEDLRGHL